MGRGTWAVGRPWVGEQVRASDREVGCSLFLQSPEQKLQQEGFAGGEVKRESRQEEVSKFMPFFSLS